MRSGPGWVTFWAFAVLGLFSALYFIWLRAWWPASLSIAVEVLLGAWGAYDYKRTKRADPLPEPKLQ